MPAHFHYHFHPNDIQFVVEVILGVATAVSAAYLRWQSKLWPAIDGTIEHHRAVAPGVDKRKAVPGIAYSYQVDGEYYSGELGVRLGRKFPKTAEDVEHLYPRGGKVQVRYKPSNPAISVGVPTEIPPQSVYFPPRDDPR